MAQPVPNPMFDDDMVVDEQGFHMWKDKLGEVKKHLEDAAKTPGVTALSFKGFPATCKSTSLIARIVAEASDSKAPGFVLYVVSTDIKRDYIRKWLSDNGIDQGPLFKLVTARTMIEALESNGHVWADDITVVVDINWYPTVNDEMFLALLLDHAENLKRAVQADGLDHMAIVLLMSSESTRTIEAFRECLGDITEIENRSVHHPELRRLDEEQLKPTIETIFKEGGRVVVAADAGMDIWSQLGDPRPAMVADTPWEDKHEESLRNLKEAKILMVNNEIPFAVQLDKVRLVICSTQMEETFMIDPEIMQLVKAPRPKTDMEVHRALSWGCKSTEYRKGAVQFCGFADSLPDLLDQCTVHNDDFGAAWNKDLLFFLLYKFKVWPRRAIDDLPGTETPNVFVYADAMGRLSVLGCIAEVSDDVFECTELGLQILKIWNDLRQTVDFHVAFLLARVAISYKGADARAPALRVLVLMAAIAHEELGQLLLLEPEHGDLVACFPPVIPEERQHAGGLWAASGLYMAALREIKTQAYPPPDVVTLTQGVHISSASALSVEKTVQVFEVLVAPSPSSGSWDRWWNMPKLTEAEVKMIDEELMWTWLYRVAHFRPEANPSVAKFAVDCVSYTKFSVEMENESLGIVPVRQASDAVTRGKGGFFVIYQSLGVSGDDYICSGLTWIPGRTFDEVPKKVGIQFPAVVNRVAIV